jgi:hypothetical protein
MKTTLDMLDLDSKMPKVAYLTPSDEGYSVLHMDLGALSVSLSDVTAYANGSRVVLVFGNPMSARLNGLKMAIDWGSVDGKGLPINDKQHTKQLTLSVAIRSGAWTRVQVVLEGVPPSELGFVRIREVEHTGISLSGE